MGFQTVSRDVLQVLQSIDPSGPYSPELYGAIARLVPSVAIEAVVLRERDVRIEVFLTRRSPQDAAYPDMLHSPGSILRAGEKPVDVMRRIGEQDFHVPVSDFVYVDEVFCHEKRGWFNSRIYLAKLKDEPVGGEWVSVDALPADVVDHHIQWIIPMAVAYFKTR
ncbi:MAG: hypothetical protein V1668_00555 [Patescibacteria group bacterium]